MNPYRILVTGFEAFNGQTINPSLEILNLLKLNDNFHLQTLALPVVYGKAYEEIAKVLLENHYDFILMIGQAAGRESICLERVALNWRDSSLPDAQKITHSESPIDSSLPPAYFNKLPLNSWAKEIQNLGYPVTVSTSAGSYVCNDLYFLMFKHMQNNNAQKTPLLFVHVPLCEQQVELNKNQKFLPLSVMTETIEKLIHLIKASSSAGKTQIN